MSFIKSFESFNTNQNSRVFVSNPDAEDSLKTFEQVDGFYATNVEEIVEILESEGFSAPHDFIQIPASLNEAFDVKFVNHDQNQKQIFITINGHKYGYAEKEGDLNLDDISRKFKTMLGFSAGKALNWLKKHTVLKTGSTKAEMDATKQIKENHNEEEMETEPEQIEEKPKLDHDSMELKNYMFFGNLKTIKRCIDKIMAMDPGQIDQLLLNGHDWAEDHVTTSKDDIEEVCNFLCNAIDKSDN